jgi:16S rRNA (cytosine1402-N4)-methyltransferase
MTAAPSHTPVMLRQVLAALAPRDGEVFVDGTFGAGGYASAILDAADCTVWAIDRDPDAVALAARLVERYRGRLTVLQGRFGDMEALLRAHGVTAVDGVTLDVGVSSMQIDQPGRGFSFRHDGPLDMRMDQAGLSAADVVNDTDQETLADIIFLYGEERQARRIARAICAARRERPFTRTNELAETVRRACRRGTRGRGRETLDPATRTFQALRIHVNDELDELMRGLDAAERLLRAGGRLAVVSFHSLEDRRVKNFLDRRAGARAQGSRHHPAVAIAAAAPSFRLSGRRAIRAEAHEITANPRARSARLRVAVRTNAPAIEPVAP